MLLGINTILHTKDGRKIGNAIIVGHKINSYVIKTDYGNTCTLDSKEIYKYFYIGRARTKEENDFCTHKYFIDVDVDPRDTSDESTKDDMQPEINEPIE